MKPIVIFGGSGFLGRFLVARLARQGKTLRIVVRHPSRGQKLLSQGQPGQIELCYGDITDIRDVEKVTAGAKAIINLVGILAPTSRQNFTTAHLQGVENIIQAAHQHQIERIIQISAIGADPNSPSDYARSKGLAEQALLSRHPSATILRPSLVYGPEDSSFNLFAQLAKLLPVIPVFGAETKFQPVYVGDVIAAIETCLNPKFSEATKGQIFELGGTKILSMLEMQQAINLALGKKPCLIPMPKLAAQMFTLLTGWLPGAPLTRDQLKLLSVDNIVSEGRSGFEALQIVPQAPYLSHQDQQIAL